MATRNAKVYHIGLSKKDPEPEEVEPIDIKVLLDEVASALEEGADPSEVASSVREIISEIDDDPGIDEEDDAAVEAKVGKLGDGDLIDMSAFVKPGDL